MAVDPTASTQIALTEAPSAPERQLIGERYEVLGLLGAGAMGNVYKARDLLLDEPCALKILRPELARTPEALERFRREVKLARRVTHPNVARVYDIGERGGEKLLSMELIDGEPLSAVLAREGPLSTARAVEIASALCAGLAAAHEAGVIHRDLKPDNVLIEKGGRVVITDFGIARAAEAGALATQGFLGTPAYMAPEQIESGAPIDARADLYALGVMLFELVTGTLPFDGPSVFAVAAARLLHPPPDPRKRRPDLPERLAALILCCLARKADDRFPSATAVAAELAAFTLPAPAPVPVPVPGDAVRERERERERGRERSEKRIAVLPFRNAGSPDHDYVADGLTEDVIDVLSMAPGLRVASRGIVMRYKGVDRDPRDVGRELDVQVVVDGTVRRGAGGVRIAARLASVADGVQLWAKRFERPDAALLSASDDVARAIAEALAVQMATVAHPLEAHPEALDLYLRARAQYHRFFDDLEGDSIKLLEQALALAPDDPRLLAAHAQARARIWSHDPVIMQSAEHSATRAVALSPTSPHAHAALGAVWFQMGDESSAVRALRRALSFSPDHADAHDLLGRIIAEVGLVEEARRHLTTALRLEPLMSLCRLGLARLHEMTGEPEEADRVVHELPRAALPALARLVFWRRDVKAAQAFYEQIAPGAKVPVTVRALLGVVGYKIDPQESLREFFVSTRGTLRARTFLAQIQAEIAGYQHDTGEALAAIARAAEGSLFDLAWMDGCPLLADVRGEAEFAALRAKVATRAEAVVRAYRESV